MRATLRLTETGMGKGRAKILVQTLKKIPLFHGLSPSQIQQVLVVCQPRRFDAHKTLCATGTPPDEMYILLSGSWAWSPRMVRWWRPCPP